MNNFPIYFLPFNKELGLLTAPKREGKADKKHKR